MTGEGRLFERALSLIINWDAELAEIILLSLEVSLSAVLLAALVGIPIGALLGLSRFPGRGLLVTAFNTLMGFPPVVMGLIVFMTLSRSGPLGELGLLFTPAAMIIAQTLLATPIVAALTVAAVTGVDPLLLKAARTLGANPVQATVTLLVEARFGILAAVIAGFGRTIAEVGAVMMVGGNIAGYTRMMTTAIALETSKGEYELGVVLGMVLLLLAFMVNICLHLLQGRGR